jgi:hypothetical protein
MSRLVSKGPSRRRAGPWYVTIRTMGKTTTKQARPIYNQVLLRPTAVQANLLVSKSMLAKRSEPAHSDQFQSNRIRFY